MPLTEQQSQVIADAYRRRELIVSRPSRAEEFFKEMKEKKLPHPPQKFLNYSIPCLLAQYHEDNDSIIFPLYRFAIWCPVKFLWYPGESIKITHHSQLSTLYNYHFVQTLEYLLDDFPDYAQLCANNDKVCAN